MKAPLPTNEKARLEALRDYAVLDTSPERAYNDLVRLASEICDAPIASIRQASPSPRRALNVLLVEDNRVNQALASALLRRAGCGTTLAEDGRKGLEILSAESFDMVFMDVCMPEMDGFEATKRIRSGECGPKAQKVFVAAMTANALEGDRQRCLDSGMNDYLTKPLNKDELTAMLDRASEIDPESPGCTVSMPETSKEPKADPRSF